MIQYFIRKMKKLLFKIQHSTHSRFDYHALSGTVPVYSGLKKDESFFRYDLFLL